jgi:hypothetical protein
MGLGLRSNWTAQILLVESQPVGYLRVMDRPTLYG